VISGSGRSTTFDYSSTRRPSAISLVQVLKSRSFQRTRSHTASSRLSFGLLSTSLTSASNLHTAHSRGVAKRGVPHTFT
jgi:hypothetical protein